MDDLLKELGKLTEIDDDELDDFLNQHRLGQIDEDKEIDISELPDQYELGEDPTLLDVDLIGKTFWKNVSEFGDKTRELATSIILRFVEGSIGGEHNLATYVSQPMKSGELFDLDLDATLESMISDPVEEIIPWGFKRKTTRNPVLLLLDTSFSMNGQKLMIAGIVVGVLSRLMKSSDLCIVGFARTTYLIKGFEEQLSNYHLISKIMQIQPRGPTNMSDAFAAAKDLLFPFHPYGKLIMLSDADPTAGINPIPEAAQLHQLDILLFPDGNKWMAQRLVNEAYKGKYLPINSYEEIPNLIRAIFQ